MMVRWREHTLGDTEQQTLNAYNNIGEALNWEGEWSAAEKYLQQALDGRKESLGTEDPDDQHGQLGLDVPESRPMDAGGRAGGASGGDEKESAGARASRHADQHEQSCLYFQESKSR
jgi:hypothetical protein